jgi:hypothetical protein
MAANLVKAVQDALEEAQSRIQRSGGRRVLNDKLTVLIESGEGTPQDVGGSDHPSQKRIMAW